MDKVEEQKLKARERARLWALAHPGSSTRYYHKNRAKIIARRAELRKNNAAKIAEQKKKAYWANIEASRERGRAYYAANAEAVKLAVRKYAQANRERVSEYHANYYASNREVARLKRKEWRIANADKKRASHAKRRALLYRAVPEEQTDSERAEIQFLYGLSRAVSAGGVAHHVDHFIPLTKGGKHCPTNLRVIPAVVNLKKKDKLLAA